MKSKKTVYIIFSVLAVCLGGVILSKVINWPVDNENAGGNIAKTSRFSRKTAEGGASNMQELEAGIDWLLHAEDSRPLLLEVKEK